MVSASYVLSLLLLFFFCCNIGTSRIFVSRSGERYKLDGKGKWIPLGQKKKKTENNNATRAIAWRYYGHDETRIVNGHRVEVKAIPLRDASAQEHGDTGAVIWDASLVLADFILGNFRKAEADANAPSLRVTITTAEEHLGDLKPAPDGEATLVPNSVTSGPLLPLHTELVLGRRVLELGAGCGFAGIVAALTEHTVSVVLTDLEYCLANMRSNMARNKVPPSKCRALPLDWFRPTQSIRDVCEGGVDTIIGADIVWLSDLVDPLAETVHQLFRACEAKNFLMVHQRRSNLIDAKFLSALNRRNIVLTTKV